MSTRRFSTRRTIQAILAIVLVTLGACGSAQPDSAATGPGADASGDGLAPQVASYDLAVGSQRFAVGLLTQEADLIGGGEVDLKFAYLGTGTEQSSGEVESEARASFLAIPAAAGEDEPEIPGTPAILPSATGTGVYAAQASFDRAGFWGVVIEADVQDRGVLTGRTTFEVKPAPEFPAVGQDAARTDNLIIGSDAPDSAIDSRAREGRDIPDPALHRITVADSIASGKATLLIVSTPTYCVSRFCGPITDMVNGLAQEYPDEANFIHIEVWRDFEAQEINAGAAEWILKGDSPSEPWVFLIDAEGKIAGRWDNVATRGEIEPALQALSG